MNETQIQILDSAFQIIQRYGISRSTMEDYAKAAGVSRRTLYSYYSGRDDLLRAIVDRVSEQYTIELKDRCGKASDISDKLDVVIEILVVRPREVVDADPDSAELIFGFHAAAEAKLEEFYAENRAVIEQVLMPYAEVVQSKGMSVESLANYLQTSLKSIKTEDQPVSAMMEKLNTLKMMVLAVINA